MEEEGEEGESRQRRRQPGCRVGRGKKHRSEKAKQRPQVEYSGTAVPLLISVSVEVGTRVLTSQ